MGGRVRQLTSQQSYVVFAELRSEVGREYTGEAQTWRHYLFDIPVELAIAVRLFASTVPLLTNSPSYYRRRDRWREWCRGASSWRHTPHDPAWQWRGLVARTQVEKTAEQPSSILLLSPQAPHRKPAASAPALVWGETRRRTPARRPYDWSTQRP